MFKKHLLDLADRSYKQGVFTFTGFLGMAEQSDFHECERDLRYATPKLCGGYLGAERQMLRFGNEAELGYELEFPIVCIKVSPLMEKFSDDLSHRDFLGALMNLGIKREVLGDIKLEGKVGYIFCQESICQFICENLTRIKHTSVMCKVTDSLEEYTPEEPQEKQLQLSSARVDAAIAKTYNLSRDTAVELIKAGRVFVNGRLCESNSLQLSGGEIINARGYGRFEYCGSTHVTKKGKLAAWVKIYK